MLLLRAVKNILVRNASALGALYLVSQDLVNCYFCFVLLPLDLRSGYSLSCDDMLLLFALGLSSSQSRLSSST